MMSLFLGQSEYHGMQVCVIITSERKSKYKFKMSHKTLTTENNYINYFKCKWAKYPHSNGRGFFFKKK